MLQNSVLKRWIVDLNSKFFFNSWKESKFGQRRSLYDIQSRIIGFTRQLAYELGPKNINVNCVCPSQTLTNMLQNSMTSEEQKKLSSEIPLRRLATVEDQVGPVIFLCSELSNYINGAVIDVNGGQI